MAMRAKDISGAAEGVRSDQLAALRRTFRGELLNPGSNGYDAARQVWNLMVDHRPALIARCLGVGDVAAAIRFARDLGLEISVRVVRPRQLPDRGRVPGDPIDRLLYATSRDLRVPLISKDDG